MKADFGLARLVGGVHGISSLQDWIKQRQIAESQQSGFVEWSEITKSPSVCIGCFHITKDQPNPSLCTEEFCLPPDKAFIIDHIHILAYNDAIQSAKFSGATFPNPGSCQFRVWAASLSLVTGCFEELTTSYTNSFGSLHFYSKETLVSDRIIVQGIFKVLTLAFIGWPVDSSGDIRLTTGKKFHVSRLSHVLGRNPFSKLVPDPCLEDAVTIYNTSQKEEYVPKSSEILAYTSSSQEKSYEFYISEYFKFIDKSLLNCFLLKEIPDTIHGNQSCRPHLIPVPTVESLEKILVMAKPYIHQFQSVLNCIDFSSNTCEITQMVLRYNLLKSTCWRKLFSLVLWPLEINGTYSRYCGIMEQPDVLLSDASTSFLPYITSYKYSHFDVEEASHEKRKLSLRFLSLLLKLSPVIVDMVTFLNGSSALVELLDWKATPSQISFHWKYPLANFDAMKEMILPKSTFSIKVLALQCLANLSKHYVGALSLLKPLTAGCQNDRKISYDPHLSNTSLYNMLVEYSVTSVSCPSSVQSQRINTILSKILFFNTISIFQACVDLLDVSNDSDSVTKESIFLIIKNLCLLNYLTNSSGSKTNPSFLRSKASTEESAYLNKSIQWSNEQQHQKQVQNFLRLTKPFQFISRFIKLNDILLKLSKGKDVLSRQDVNMHRNSKQKEISILLEYTEKQLNNFVKGSLWFRSIHLLSYSSLVSVACALYERLCGWFLQSRLGLKCILSCCSCSECHRCLWVPTSKPCDESTVCILSKLPFKFQNTIRVCKKAFLLITNLIMSSETHDTLHKFLAYSITSITGEMTSSENEESESHLNFRISLQNLSELSMFLNVPTNVAFFVRCWENISTLVAYLSFGLRSIVQRQIELELNEKKNPLSRPIKSLDPLETIKDLNGDLANLAALCHMVNIIWCIWRDNDSYEILDLLALSCYDTIVLLCTKGLMPDEENIRDHSYMDSEKGSVSKLLLARLSQRSSNHFAWGETDLSLQAYENLESFESSTGNDVNMLQYFVPALAYTSLKQIFDSDWRFLSQLYDLLTGMELFASSKTYTDLNESTNSTNLDMKTSLFQEESVKIFEASDTVKSNVPDNSNPTRIHDLIFFSSYAKLETLLTSFLTITQTMHLFQLIPFVESNPMCASGGTAQNLYTTPGQPNKRQITVTPLQLGGYKGTVGVSIVELNTLLKSGKEGKFNEEITQNNAPPNSFAWKSSLSTCLRAILRILQTHTEDKAHAHLMKSLQGNNERLAVISSTCFEAPHLLILNKFTSLCPAITKVFNACSACLSPSLILGQGSMFVYQLQGQQARAWYQSAKDILPITVAILQFTYTSFHLLFSADFKQTKTNLFQGIIIDFNMQNSIIFLTSRLLQLFVHISRKSTYNIISSTDVNYPDPVADIDNSCMENLITALDTVEQLIKLLCCQCPDASAFFLESVIQQSRLFPSNFILSPFVVSCLNGLQFILSENEPVITWGNKILPLIALELNGAEGRNFEAVITRLKQMYIQHRHIENTNVTTGNEAPPVISMTSKLPASMTTLCLSTRINLPQEMRNYLNVGKFPFSLVIKIPLAKPPTVKKSPDEQLTPGEEYRSFIPQRRLGRLSMGNTSDILSFSVFDPESKNSPEKQEPTTQSMEAKSDSNIEWTSWDRVWELLNNSLGEEAIETAIGSNFSPTMLLGLSVNDILQSTNSSACVKQMMQQINKEQVDPDKAHSETLYKILRRYKQLNIENIGEFIEILLMGVYTSNHLLHAAVSKTLSILIETNGPPVFDLILHTAHFIAKNLYKHLLLEEKNNKATAVSRLLVLCRLVILIDSTLGFLTEPSMEASLCLLEIASAGLQTLQNVPMLDDSWPKIPIFICIFDCLLPLFSRLLSKGIKILSFDYFTFTLTNNFTNDTPISQDQNQINDQENDKFMRSLKYSNQFKIFLQKQSVFSEENTISIQGPRSCSKILSNPSYASNISQGYQNSLRSCCKGLSTIINQLPIAYDIYKRETILLDQLTPSLSDWSGLSLSVVIQILTVFEEISRHPILRLISFYNFQEDFLKLAFTYKNSYDTDMSKPQFINGEPEATIQLHGIFSSVFDFLTLILHDVKKNLENIHFEEVLDVTYYLVKICSTLILDSNLYSIQLLSSLGFGYVSADVTPDQSVVIDEKSTTVQEQNNGSQIDLQPISDESSTKEILLYTLLSLLNSLDLHLSSLNSSVIDKYKTFVIRIRELIQQIKDIEAYVSIKSATNLLPTKLDLSDLLSSSKVYEHNLDANFFFFDPGLIRLLQTFSTKERFHTKHCTTSSRAILKLAIDLKNDSLWRMSSFLDKLAAPFSNDSVGSSEEILLDDPPLKCLSNVVWSQIANNVLTNEGGPTSFLRDTFSLTTTKNQATISRANTITSVSSEPVTTDTFRTRRGPSSRAPSKHVDEFQAQQLKNDTAYKVKQNLPASDSSLEGSLDVIPEWREFVLSGKERGLDVMGILKNPQVLQDPSLECRFRSLVELHPSIKTLFSMMEIDTGL